LKPRAIAANCHGLIKKEQLMQGFMREFWGGFRICRDATLRSRWQFSSVGYPVAFIDEIFWLRAALPLSLPAFLSRYRTFTARPCTYLAGKIERRKQRVTSLAEAAKTAFLKNFLMPLCWLRSDPDPKCLQGQWKSRHLLIFEQLND